MRSFQLETDLSFLLVFNFMRLLERSISPVPLTEYISGCRSYSFKIFVLAHPWIHARVSNRDLNNIILANISCDFVGFCFKKV